MASPTRWKWVWVNSGSWWWTGRPGVLRFMGSQRVGHHWVTDLIWSDLKLYLDSLMSFWVYLIIVLLHSVGLTLKNLLHPVQTYLIACHESDVLMVIPIWAGPTEWNIKITWGIEEKQDLTSKESETGLWKIFPTTNSCGKLKRRIQFSLTSSQNGNSS